MPDHRLHDDAGELARFWDAIVRGDPDPERDGLDAETAALVHRFQGAARTAFPAGACGHALEAAMRALPHRPYRLNGKEIT